MKVVVTGASGLLGRQVYQALLKSKLVSEVHGTCFSRATQDLVPVDLTSNDAVETLLKKVAPDIIVHCAAERRPDVVEKKSDVAEKLNVTATDNLCRLSGKIGAWVLYLSTDYVFDGTAAPYTIDGTPNPLNKYGQMKLDGERKVLECSEKNAVLRVPILYGPIEYLGESAVTILFEKVKDSIKPCIMDHRQRRFPTHTSCVADIITQLVERHSEKRFSVTGIYHFSEAIMMTKYDMAISMAKAFNLDMSHIQADTAEPRSGSTPRPYDCQLDTSRLVTEGFKPQTTSFTDAVKSVLFPYM